MWKWKKNFEQKILKNVTVVIIPLSQSYFYTTKAGVIKVCSFIQIITFALRLTTERNDYRQTKELNSIMKSGTVLICT